jgi:hypothetical protein
MNKGSRENALGAGRVTQRVESCPSQFEDLSSNPSTVRKKKEENALKEEIHTSTG